jgi:lauroyl/myristoyl acyltransferase
MPKLFMLNLEELFYRFLIVPLVAFLPAQWAYGVACLRADWRYRHDTLTRERILHNLKEFFGSRLSCEEYDCILRNFFRRRSCEFIDAMRLAGSGRALARLVKIRGLEHIEAALASGKGAMLCCGHFGSFNVAFSLLGVRGFPITAVGNWRTTEYPDMPKVKQFIFNLSFNNKVARHRRRPNIEPMKERFRSAIRIAEVLRSNELIAIPIDAPYTFDQPRAMPISSNELIGSPIEAAALPAVRSRTVPVDFLDRQILLMPGSVKIAQLTGTAVLVAVLHRSADWRHQVLEISPPVSLDGDAVTVLQRCVKMLEGPIAQNPAYWDWWGDRQDLVDLGLLSAHA